MAASFFLASLPAATLPPTTSLEARLFHVAGSSASHVGDRVEASVISPVYNGASLLIAAGATVSGSVEHIDKLGLGLRHASARLDLHFTQLHLPNGSVVPLDAIVSSVETAREYVRTDGAVIGINPTANFSTGVSALFTLIYLGERELRLWRDAESGAWLGAATEDVSYAFQRGGLTHATDRTLIMNERRW